MKNNIPLFVYGTLRYGRGNWKYYLSSEEKATCVETNCKTKEKAFTLGGSSIPFMNRSNKKDKGYVKGDLFFINENTLKELDSLEGHPTLYRREIIKIQKTDNSEIYAWAYLFPNAEESRFTSEHHTTNPRFFNKEEETYEFNKLPQNR